MSDNDIYDYPVRYAKEVATTDHLNRLILDLVIALSLIANYEFGGHTPPEMRKIASDALENLRVESRKGNEDAEAND